ncbi:hypothetical protein D9758_015465 [Tetrapyrgos nigripes]|uniref:Uncharacterized protein n=1 Tax=Tetrapyrgos nigripes TaxID=182062 RepID=A0A8H5CMH6_9AGAR|nr:hypothetical protein D9758_015465 [Tetrapyrgos nigripes]
MFTPIFLLTLPHPSLTPVGGFGFDGQHLSCSSNPLMFSNVSLRQRLLSLALKINDDPISNVFPIRVTALPLIQALSINSPADTFSLLKQEIRVQART